MAKDSGFHTFNSVTEGTRVHDNRTHEDVGWVDGSGNVHQTGDTGLLSEPATIGHVNGDGSVTMNKK
jgi:hypothetical protein